MEKRKIGIVGHGRDSIGMELSMAVLNDMPIIIHRPEHTVRIVPPELTAKQQEIIKAMVYGAVIEITNGVSYCNGIHLTSKSLKYLKGHGLIERKCFVGNYSSQYQLTEKANIIFNPQPHE